MACRLRIQKNFFDPTSLGADTGGGRGGEEGYSTMPTCEMSKKGFLGMLIKNPEEFFGSHPPGGGYKGGGDFTKLTYILHVSCLFRFFRHVD